MPLFLHCRAAGKEMIDILHRQSDNLEAKGVIHSFDGTLEEANTFIQMGYFIGINGWYVHTDMGSLFRTRSTMRVRIRLATCVYSKQAIKYFSV